MCNNKTKLSQIQTFFDDPDTLESSCKMCLGSIVSIPVIIVILAQELANISVIEKWHKHPLWLFRYHRTLKSKEP